MTLVEKYIQHLEKCFEKAERKKSKLIQEVHDIPGMTGEMTRHFYNNLLEMEDARYLELGVWSGSSSCSAMYKNKATMVFIDDFSQFGSPKETFLSNFEKYKGENDAVFIETDCFKIDTSILKTKFNIYLADADHSEQSQFMALDYYLPVMDDVFIFIADDANWYSVIEGTLRAIQKNKLQVLWSKEILLTRNNQFTPEGDDKNNWWNGMACYILKKTQ